MLDQADNLPINQIGIRGIDGDTSRVVEQLGDLHGGFQLLLVDGERNGGAEAQRCAHLPQHEPVRLSARVLEYELVGGVCAVCHGLPRVQTGQVVPDQQVQGGVFHTMISSESYLKSNPGISIRWLAVNPGLTNHIPYRMKVLLVADRLVLHGFLVAPLGATFGPGMSRAFFFFTSSCVGINTSQEGLHVATIKRLQRSGFTFTFNPDSRVLQVRGGVPDDARTIILSLHRKGWLKSLRAIWFSTETPTLFAGIHLTLYMASSPTPKRKTRSFEDIVNGTD